MLAQHWPGVKQWDDVTTFPPYAESNLRRPSAAVAELKGRQVVTPSSREAAGALRLLLSRMPRQDADLLRVTLMGMKRADDEHACWAARTMYHYLPQLPDEPRRDLTRALFTS